jgi:hypothetical protein
MQSLSTVESKRTENQLSKQAWPAQVLVHNTGTALSQRMHASACANGVLYHVNCERRLCKEQGASPQRGCDNAWRPHQTLVRERERESYAQAGHGGLSAWRVG